MTIRVKEHDLHVIIKDLIDKALEIDRPNKEKICRFIVNLVNNGGNKSIAAMDAGLGGSEKDANGNKRTFEQMRSAAATEANRLLKNAQILSVYEKLLAHRMTSIIFTQSMSKEHIINVLYQIGINSHDKNPRQAVAALKEAATLAGYYRENAQGDEENVLQKIDELHKAMSVKDEFMAANIGGSDERGSKKYN